jgi:hypothetical protein
MNMRTTYYTAMLLCFLFEGICGYSQQVDGTSDTASFGEIRHSSWTEVEVNQYSQCSSTKCYTFEGDITINGYQYAKLNNGDGVRETKDGKVYIYLYAEKKELLAYDFAWEVGKNMYFEYLDYDVTDMDMSIRTDSIKITQIDSILLLDGKYYKRVRDFVQGIGHLSDFYYTVYSHGPMPTCGPIEKRISCYYRNGALLYKSPNDETCNACDLINDVPAIAVGRDKAILVKQSSDGVILECLENNEISLVYIFDIAGKQLGLYQMANRREITVNGLAPGVYFYSAIGKNKKYSDKFIVTK